MDWTLRTSSVGGANLTEIPRFWEAVNRDGRGDALASLAGDLGLLGLCAEMDMSSEAFTYLIGVENRPGTAYPEGTRVLRVPQATYAVFTAVGPIPQTIQETWKQAYSEWFPTSGYDHNGTPDFEAYPQGDIHSPAYESEVWIPVKKKG